MADFNPFDNLFEQESLPPEHKREVLRTIDTLKLMADMANLFSVQQARTGGSVLGQVLGNATVALGVGAGRLIAGAVYWFLLITVTLSALQQMGLPTDILSQNLQLVIGAVVVAGAVSYGLASRDVLRNTLSNYYSRNTFEVGQRIRVEGVEGTIEEVTGIAVILRTPSGRTVLPATELTTKRVEILEA